MLSLSTRAWNPRPRVLLAHADERCRWRIERYLRSQGVDVTSTNSADSARRMARWLGSGVIILGTQLAEESGFLTCAKLKLEFPEARVLMLAESPTCAERRLASFVAADRFLNVAESLDTLRACVTRFMEITASD